MKLNNLQPKEIKYKGHTIKGMNFNDALKISKLKTHIKIFGICIKKITPIIPTEDELLKRVRSYILNNSNPKIDINELSPKEANKLITTVTTPMIRND